MSGKVTKYDMGPLHTFVKGVSAKHVVKVGIFGNKNGRSTKRGAPSTNAELGALHEFGSYSKGIPPRSFLRMPIHQKSKEILNQAGNGAGALIAAGKMILVLKRLGIACENAVQAAFASRGFGKWKPNAPMTIRLKGSDMPLIDTGQLRRAVSSQVD